MSLPSSTRINESIRRITEQRPQIRRINNEHSFPTSRRLKSCDGLHCLASTTSFLDALLAHQGGSSAASAASTAQAMPLVYKGKRYGKYKAKLRPTKLNGKVVGDAGASGTISIKAVKYSSTSYSLSIKFLVLNLKAGEQPTFDSVASCSQGSTSSRFTFTNITRPNSRRKRYSFRARVDQAVTSETNMHGAIAQLVSLHLAIGRAGNNFALCGKAVKVK
ncbi:unnamed protein product [Closterium sp. Yama58-4]|nr:unnamed protein product [Closterium sp. Yama58-4]